VRNRVSVADQREFNLECAGRAKRRRRFRLFRRRKRVQINLLDSAFVEVWKRLGFKAKSLTSSFEVRNNLGVRSRGDRVNGHKFGQCLVGKHVCNIALETRPLNEPSKMAAEFSPGRKPGDQLPLISTPAKRAA